jgi:hypothetical protein
LADLSSDSATHSELTSSRSSVSGAGHANDGVSGDVTDSNDDLSKEAIANKVANKNDPTQMTDSQKELQVIAEQGKPSELLHEYCVQLCFFIF